MYHDGNAVKDTENKPRNVTSSASFRPLSAQYNQNQVCSGRVDAVLAR